MGQKVFFAVMLLGLAAKVGTAGESAQTQPPYVLVRFENATAVTLPFEFPGYPFYMAYPCRPVVPMRPGMPYQVLIPSREDDVGLPSPFTSFLVYRPGDPTRLAFEARGCRLLMNGKPVLLFRGENGAEGVSWLSSAPEENLKSLRCIELSPELLLYGGEALDRLSTHNPHVGLTFANSPSEDEQTGEASDKPNWVALGVKALNRFRPRVLVLPPEILASADLGDTALEDVYWLLLGSTSDKPKDEEVLWERLEEASQLQHLVLASRNMDTQWQRFQKLQSLVVGGIDGADLKSIAMLPNLQSLSLFQTEALDLTPLSGCPALKVLNLNGSKNVKHLDQLDEVELTWFAPPPDITAEQLKAFLSQHPELRVLALHKTENLSLDALQLVPDLRVLVLTTEAEDLEPVASLKQLELLILHKAYWSDGAYWPVTLHRELPDTEIALGGGLCLGSGWILLLVPAAALAIWGTRRRRR